MKRVRKKRRDAYTDEDVFAPGKNEKVGMTIVGKTNDDHYADRWIRRVRYRAIYPCCGELVTITHEALMRRERAGAGYCRSCAVTATNIKAAKQRGKNKAVPDATGWASPPSSKERMRMTLR